MTYKDVGMLKNSYLHKKSQDIFSGDFVYADKSALLQNKFSNFNDFIDRAQALNLTLDFDNVPTLPKYPAKCAAYFDDKTRRVGYEYVTKTITDIDTLKINKDAIYEIYSSSAHLKREYGGIKIFSSDLIAELQAGRSIYIYWSYGYLRACTESEAESFAAYHAEISSYQTKIKAFEKLVKNITQNEYKIAQGEQSEQISATIGVKWKGAFIIQSRLLHDKNFFGNQKKNTVVHLHLLDDYQKGRVKRDAGQLMCGNKAKFSLSDDMADTKDYIVTCRQCLKLIGVQP